MDKQKIKDFFSQKDKYAKHSGIELVEVEEGRAVCTMKIEEIHFNGVRVAHGGAIFTLADFAFAVASNSYGQVAVAVNVNISFLKAAKSGVLTAEATEVTRGKTIATYQILVRDEEGSLVANFQGMAYRMKADLLDFENQG